jgi:beta-lactamase class A
MRHHFLRRRWLPVVLAMVVCAAPGSAWAGPDGVKALNGQLAALEREAGGRLGLVLRDPATGRRFAYQGGERFPLCSTFKLVLAAAVLHKSQDDPGLLAQPLAYGPGDLLAWAPVTRRSLEQGRPMTVAELCAAAIQVSDNTAANQLLGKLGGPEALTAYARSLGDQAFRLDRREPDLNSAVPGDPRDTTTPEAMARTVEKLVLGDALGAPQRRQLADWLKGNTTGGESIRAGAPAGWTVGDKTGSGGYGTTNDVAVLWPPQGGPLVLAVYFTQAQKDAHARKDVLAAATRLTLAGLGYVSR